MAFVKKDRVRESSTTTGTGAIALGGAPNTSYQAFSAVMSLGDTCWYAIVLPGSAWETGIGTYSGVNTLQRTTVLESSNANAAVSFGAGTKDVFLGLPASEVQPAFPSGTILLFQQTAAPIYWTKQAVHNDKVLRVVSGTAGSGGTNAFSAVNAQTVVGNTTITNATAPSHAHTFPTQGNTATFPSTAGQGGNNTGASVAATSSVGSDGAHNHSIAFSIAYVDIILCMKD